MSYSKKKLDPVSEEMAQLEKDRNEPPKWTTGEVAAATSLKCARLRAMALKLGIKDGFIRGQPNWWTFTDVMMILREIDKEKPKPRDHKKAAMELRSMIRAAREKDY
ncbi:MAG: hypothetical protein IKF39_00120 [Oscillospiraceae bacterium]|nr:hypothetical protein [Oscillospiraceae bacterium]